MKLRDVELVSLVYINDLPSDDCQLYIESFPDVGDYTEFESLAVKLTGRRSKSSVVVCLQTAWDRHVGVHRPAV